MPDMDDFFINDDELAADHQLTLLDEAKIKVLDYIIKLAQEMKSNLEFSEIGNYEANFSSVSSQFGILSDLSVDTSGMSDDDMEEIIENAFKKSTEITYSNMGNLLSEEEDTSISINPSDNIADDGTDF